MIIEQELCKALAAVFEGVLNGVSIDGNWIPPKGGNPKGAEARKMVSLYIRVGSRNYTSYTTRVAEIMVSFEFKAALASDPNLSRSAEAYEATVGRLEDWQHDIEAVKRDLTIEAKARDEGEDSTLRLGLNPSPSPAFDPVGLVLGGNAPEFDPKDEDENRTFTQTITIKGRISK